MELIPEFIKDLSSNYMVLRPLEAEEDSFLLKMLVKNHIDGLLKIEMKVINNQKYYYYDITGRQTLHEMIQVCPISFLQLQKIYSKLMKLPDICKEFLIYENGIFIEPDFIYMDTSWDKIEFCYYPGMNRSLQEQIGKFTEYLLNKVDYKDERAVLAVHALYQVSHDKSCTLEKLKEAFERQYGKADIDIGNAKIGIHNTNIDKDNIDNIDTNTNNTDINNTVINNTIIHNTGMDMGNINNKIELSKKELDKGKVENESESMKSRIKKLDVTKKLDNDKNEKEKKEKEEDSKRGFPYMEERIENQKEVVKYPLSAYIQAVFVLCAGLVVLFILMKAGILTINGSPDGKRCIIAVACYIAILGTAFFIIFRKEKRYTEVKEDIDYIDWEEDYNSLPMPEIYGLTVSEPIEKNYYQDAFLRETRDDTHSKKSQKSYHYNEGDEGKEIDTETELLVDFCEDSVAYLESEFSGERIYLKKFPFLIGKLKKGTDYMLENNKISRIHARFDYDESHHYIEDMDSTNGTSLNGTALLAHDRRMLSNGDRICLADKNFIFHC